MSITEQATLERSKLDASRLRHSFGASLLRRRRHIQRRLAGKVWLHRAAAWAGVVGAVLVQACLFSLAARFVVGIDLSILPGLTSSVCGLVAGAGMLGLRPLAEAAVTSA
jgi:hypothetical protein